MNKNYILGSLIGFSILFIAILIVWAFLVSDKPEHQIGAFGIVAAMITTLTSIFMVNLNHAHSKEREIETMLMAEKKKVFEHFYNAFFLLIFSDKIGRKNKKNTEQEGLEEMLKFKQGLLNWGSETIIIKYMKYESYLTDSDDNQDLARMLDEGDKFLKELRAEMGFTDTKDVNLFSIILTKEAREELKVSLP